MSTDSTILNWISTQTSMECALHLGLAVAIPVLYVGLLYVFDYGGKNRDDPRSIRRRFLAAIVACSIATTATYCTLRKDISSAKLASNAMGMKTSGILSAILLPTVLTLILYFGSFVIMYVDGSLQHFLSVDQWKNTMSNLRWIRNSIVAPITEEIAFRSCSAALVLQCLDWRSTVFVAPLFFSLSHFHHVLDQRKQGASLNQAILGCAFQAIYTYLFGIYATFLFLRTGHIIAPIVSHIVCNNLGLPPVDEISYHPRFSTRILLWASFLFGLIAWMFALFPLTETRLYS